MRKIICFSEASERSTRYLKEYSNNKEIVFNGSVIQHSLEETIYFLQKIKKMRIICVREKFSYELSQALLEQGPYENYEINEELERKIHELYNDYDKQTVEKYVSNLICFIIKTKGKINRSMFKDKKIRELKSICDTLRKNLTYYYYNSVTYFLKDKQLVLGEYGEFDENFIVTKPLEYQKKLPFSLAFYRFLEGLDDDRMDTIIIPTVPLTDYGFCDKIANYYIISLNNKRVYHSRGIGSREHDKSPICFYEEGKIWGNTCNSVKFEYDPSKIKVCMMEDINNNIVEFFKILDTKTVSIWFNRQEQLIFYTNKGLSPKGLSQHSYKSFLKGEIEPEKEEYRVSISMDDDAPESPVSSP